MSTTRKLFNANIATLFYGKFLVIISVALLVGACNSNGDQTASPSPADTLEIKRLTDLAFKTYWSKPDSGLYYAKEALWLSLEKKWVRGQALAYNSIGAYYFVRGTRDSAAMLFHAAVNLNYQIQDVRAIASNLNNIATIYNRIHDFQRSILYLDSAATFYKRTGNNFRVEMATILLNKGSAYYYLKKYPQAKQCYNEAMKVFDSLKIDDARAQVINNLANVQSQTGEYVAAIRNYQQAEKILRAVGGIIEEPTVLTNKGLALLHCSEAELQILGVVPNARFDTTFTLFNQAEAQAVKEENMFAKADVFEAKAEWYEIKRDYQSALQFRKQYEALVDSNENVTISNTIAVTSTESKYRVLAFQNEQKAKKKDEIKSSETKGTIFIAVAICCLLLGTVLVARKWHVRDWVVRSIGLMGILSFTEALQFAYHYFIHSYITEKPWWTLLLLIITAGLIISPIHEQLMKYLNPRRQNRENEKIEGDNEHLDNSNMQS